MTIDLIVNEQTGRLDRYLSQQIQEISRSQLQKLIEQGHVTVNQQLCIEKKTKIKLGDRIGVEIPTPKPLALEAENITLDILYEDDQLIFINKPAGLVVHPSPGHWQGTLVNALLFHCDNLAGIGGVERPGIVHRLDKDTTGVLVVAKTDLAHQSLQAQIKAKTAQREYLGVVYGNPATETGIIDQPLGRHPSDRKKMAVIPVEKGGRNALTHWAIKERLGNFTLMHFRLETGRTHQIRVHSSFMGHPIVGDPLYSAGKIPGVNLSGQALHAWRLTLIHPVTGEVIEAIAPLSPEFNKLLTKIRMI
jgi:23S rRNA pseudouridine1911/1915/1917 synthase